MKRILIVESDATLAQALARRLLADANYEVALVDDLRHAYLFLAQAPQDLALVPLDQPDLEGFVHAVRTLQPDLRLVVTTPTVNYAVPPWQRGLVQGVLIQSYVETDLETVIEQALRHPFSPDYGPRGLTETGRLPLLAAHLPEVRGKLRETALSHELPAVILSDGRQLVGHHGTLHRRESAAVALLVHQSGADAASAVQLQFVHFPGDLGERLLYSAPAPGGLRLTIVAMPDSPLPWLREVSEAVIAALEPLLVEPAPESAGAADGPGPSLTVGEEDAPRERRQYRLLLRPVRALPPSLGIPLRRAMARVGEAHNFGVSDISLEPELVQLVVSPPPQRGPAWAAHLLKSGTEAAVQAQFQIAATLWQSGHYAAPVNAPLPETVERLLAAPTHRPSRANGAS